MDIVLNYISWQELVVLGVLVVLLMVELYYYLRYIAAVTYPRYRQTVEPEAKPGVSVIVCAKNEEANLEVYLQSLLTQDYPEYEVIVVNDASEDNTRGVLEEYMRQDHRLRTTFIPPEARLRSTKKLGITLAAKSAKYDYLLLTDADCRPESHHWISRMMSGFAQPGKEVVLGYGALYEQPTRLNRWIQYDTIYNAALFLGAALAGKPYMGVGRNLAYTKDLFFRSGGFSDQMKDRSGDDDLFVNKVATGSNTAVVLGGDATTWSSAKTTWQDWVQQKRRHLSVSPRYRAGSKWIVTMGPLVRALIYMVMLVAAIWGGDVSRLAVIATFVLRMVMLLVVMNVVAKRMGHSVRFSLNLIGYEIAMPIVTAVMMLLPQPKRYFRW